MLNYCHVLSSSLPWGGAWDMVCGGIWNGVGVSSGKKGRSQKRTGAPQKAQCAQDSSSKERPGAQMKTQERPAKESQGAPRRAHECRIPKRPGEPKSSQERSGAPRKSLERAQKRPGEPMRAQGEPRNAQESPKLHRSPRELSDWVEYKKGCLKSRRHICIEPRLRMNTI